MNPISDDFTIITGIGKIRQKWLQKSFSINTFHELAQLSASEIEGKAKEDGKRIARTEIESWIQQAGDLIPESIASRQTSPINEVEELADKLTPSGNQNGWKSFASFLVYFQIREKNQEQTPYQTLVHHIEKDKETSWQGIKAEKLSNWILMQISDDIQLPDLTERDDEDEEQSQFVNRNGKPQAEIKIHQVRLYQPASAAAPTYQIEIGSGFEGQIVSSQPFRFAVDFSLRGENASRLADQNVTCTARCYEYNNQTRNSALLSETPFIPLEADRVDYTFEIPAASLSSGDYRLWIMVTTMQTDQLKPDFLEVPLIKVS